MARKTKKTATRRKKAEEPVIAEATGGAAGGAKTPNPRGQRMEAAMVEAINKAMAEGVSDPVKIREAMAAAREKAKAEPGDAG
ncbi:MAG TPA: hypothetical protein VK575_00385 [Gemmatimonadaceae bacterium]|nr:hypothetical protein [Gemmatimonadaceae bacterium]